MVNNSFLTNISILTKFFLDQICDKNDELLVNRVSCLAAKSQKISDTILNGPSGSSRVTMDSPSVYVSPTESSDFVSRYLVSSFLYGIQKRVLNAVKQYFFSSIFNNVKVVARSLCVHVFCHHPLG